MRSLIISTLSSTYIVENFDFMQNVYGSDVFALVDSLEGVRYADIKVLILTAFKFTAQYSASFNITMLPIDYSVSKVLMKHKDDVAYTQIGAVNNTGVITGVNGYNTDGSSIDLSGGTGYLIVNSNGSGTLNHPISEYDLYFEFNVADTENIILTGRNQIINYFDSDVEVSYYNGV